MKEKYDREIKSMKEGFEERARSLLSNHESQLKDLTKQHQDELKVEKEQALKTLNDTTQVRLTTAELFHCCFLKLFRFFFYILGIEINLVKS